ncbi:MAG: cell division protein ZipA [Rhodanobacter sp.]
MLSSLVLAFAWNPVIGVPMAVVGVIVLALIWLFGQPRNAQGKRRPLPGVRREERHEPVLGEHSDDSALAFGALDLPSAPNGSSARPDQGELDVGLRTELERLGATLSGQHMPSPENAVTVTPVAPVAPTPAKPQPKLADHVASIIDALRAPPAPGADTQPVNAAVTQPAAPATTATVAPATEPLMTPPPRSDLGRRPAKLPVERIVTLFVVAREGALFNGADLVVAAEKAGLEFGDMGIYHRLLDGKRELGPIFSVANMLKPGNFDLAHLDTLHTPGMSFFMTLPAPLPALDAWDAMLPTAQRLAELLDGHVLDEERNALGRQCIAHIRDQLRAWDRDHEGKAIIFGR